MFNLINLKDILLITPPFTQLNTPYPATVYLKGFLNTKGISSFQVDLGIEVILKLFTREKMSELFELAAKKGTIDTENEQRIYQLRNDYLTNLEPIVKFLQGNNPSMARQICSDNFLPRASRFDQLDDMDWAFGNMGIQDKAKHLATLFLEDLSDFIVNCVDEHFGFSRYAERLGKSPASFDEMHDQLNSTLSFIDEISLDLLSKHLTAKQPKLVCFSIPFPGNLFAAFRCAQYIKKNHPAIKVAMGGGYPNTELRSITENRVFHYFDFISLDDGELPIELIASSVLKNSSGNSEMGELKRTFVLENDQVVYKNNCQQQDYKQADIGTPDYSDLLLDQYISVIEIANPMHSLWSDGRWNKLTMAHGCYWAKCTFCDISLDYIKLYEPITAKLLVDRMEQIIEQTSETGFHFVDEAAPPALMKELALEIIKRDLSVTWWTNIRFEKNFSHDLCCLLQASGCIAVSGGLEVASDRLLKLIDKGVTVETVAQTCRNFTDNGIMVHSYLMYGYPTQTIQETIDSLEMVRQLFELGIIQSGFWHQFALTAHSPIGMNSKAYGLEVPEQKITFAKNDIEFTDNTGIDHNQFSYGLKKSLYNYMHEIGFELPLSEWFDFKIPKTIVHPEYIESCINEEPNFNIKPSSRVIWLGSSPNVAQQTKARKSEVFEQITLTFQTKTDSFEIKTSTPEGEWLIQLLAQIHPKMKSKTFSEMKSDFEKSMDNFELFWHSKPVDKLRENGLLIL